MIAALLRGTDGRLAHGMGAEALPACRLKHTKRTETMLKTLAILALGAAFYGPVLALGGAAIGFAADTVAAVNEATAARCASYNAVTPGTCLMP